MNSQCNMYVVDKTCNFRTISWHDCTKISHRYFNDYIAKRHRNWQCSQMQCTKLSSEILLRWRLVRNFRLSSLSFDLHNFINKLPIVFDRTKRRRLTRIQLVSHLSADVAIGSSQNLVWTFRFAHYVFFPKVALIDIGIVATNIF